MTQNGQQKNFGLKNLIQDLITTAEMTNHAPTTNLVLLFLPCPPISLNFIGQLSAASAPAHSQACTRSGASVASASSSSRGDPEEEEVVVLRLLRGGGGGMMTTMGGRGGRLWWRRRRSRRRGASSCGGGSEAAGGVSSFFFS